MKHIVEFMLTIIMPVIITINICVLNQSLHWSVRLWPLAIGQCIVDNNVPQGKKLSVGKDYSASLLTSDPCWLIRCPWSACLDSREVCVIPYLVVCGMIWDFIAGFTPLFVFYWAFTSLYITLLSFLFSPMMHGTVYQVVDAVMLGVPQQ